MDSIIRTIIESNDYIKDVKLLYKKNEEDSISLQINDNEIIFTKSDLELILYTIKEFEEECQNRE